jgi:hypothetical protein
MTDIKTSEKNICVDAEETKSYRKIKNAVMQSELLRIIEKLFNINTNTPIITNLSDILENATKLEEPNLCEIYSFYKKDNMSKSHTLIVLYEYVSKIKNYKLVENWINEYNKCTVREFRELKSTGSGTIVMNDDCTIKESNTKGSRIIVMNNDCTTGESKFDSVNLKSTMTPDKKELLDKSKKDIIRNSLYKIIYKESGDVLDNLNSIILKAIGKYYIPKYSIPIDNLKAMKLSLDGHQVINKMLLLINDYDLVEQWLIDYKTYNINFQ